MVNESPFAYIKIISIDNYVRIVSIDFMVIFMVLCRTIPACICDIICHYKMFVLLYVIIMLVCDSVCHYNVGL